MSDRRCTVGCQKNRGSQVNRDPQSRGQEGGGDTSSQVGDSQSRGQEGGGDTSPQVGDSQVGDAQRSSEQGSQENHWSQEVDRAQEVHSPQVGRPQGGEWPQKVDRAQEAHSPQVDWPQGGERPQKEHCIVKHLVTR
jgi:hypothetical protein